METLTQVQEAAIEYNLRSKRPNDHRVRRKTGRMVREYCQARGYTPEQTSLCVGDMWDVLALERNAD
jgi:hypothetical protein